MMELFDMGKYDFFVWGSIAVFIVALLLDFISARNQKNKLSKQIKAHIRKTQARKTDNRREQT